MNEVATLRRWRARATQWLIERLLGAPADVPVFIGDRPREFAPYIRIDTRVLWAASPRSEKIRALVQRHWRPSASSIDAYGRQLYREIYFGGEEDCGEHLAILNNWHLRRAWKLEAISEPDRARANALAIFTVLTRQRYQGLEASSLNLRIAQRAPYVADLIYPMVAKMPIVSLRYFLDLHVHYAFDAIRHAKHPFSDDIISFLYDLLFLQQKVALGLLEYGRLMTYAAQHKGKAQLINAEVDAIMAADGLFAYLKASVEKTIALVGVTYGIPNLDAKKDHKKRIAALRAGLPPGVEKLAYSEFLFSMVGSENLEDLNNYRSGLLHKRGIADLQPHNYVGQPVEAIPFRKIFGVLHEQHTKNTALLVVALALLTDRLAQLDPPPFDRKELPTAHKIAEVSKRLSELSKVVQAEEVAATAAIERARALNADAVPSELLIARADLRLRLGRDKEALTDFREGLKQGAQLNADALYDFGNAFVGLDEEGADMVAVDAFSRALELAPDMDRAYLARALAYENLGEIESAMADLDVIIPRVPKPGPLFEKRGLWRLSLGRHADAVADLDTASSLGHESSDLLTGRAVALSALGDRVAALAALNIAVERYPDAVVARTHRATALIEAGDVAAARADLDRIIEHSSDHWKAPAVFAIRALVRNDAGDYAGAVADLEKAVARSREVPPPEWLSLLTAIRSKAELGNDNA